MSKRLPQRFRRLATLSGWLSFVATAASAAPAIHSFHPAAAGTGDTISILGSGFAGSPENVVVYVGPVEAQVLSVAPEEIRATLPAYLSNGRVTVVLPDGKAAISGASFQALLDQPGTLTSRSFASVPRDWPPGDGEDPAVSLLIPDTDGQTGPSQGANLADLSRDGRPDIIVANWNGDALLAFENVHESGRLEETSFIRRGTYATGARPTSTAVGDLNGDGWLDVVVGSAMDERLSLYQNTTASGSAVELTPRGSLQVGSISGRSEISIADFDGDGLMDVIMGGSKLHVLRARSLSAAVDPANYSLHTLTPPWQFFPQIAVADLNGNGRPDLVAGPDGFWVQVFRNESQPGTVAVGSPALLGAGGSSLQSVRAEDITGNGLPDLIVGSSSGELLLYENTSRGEDISFAPPIFVEIPISTFQILNAGATDLSGDGSPDLWFVNRYSGLHVAQNLGHGPLSSRFKKFVATGVPAGNAGTGVAGPPVMGDLSGDGRQDLVSDGFNQIYVSQNSVRDVAQEGYIIRASRRTVTVPWHRGARFSSFAVYEDGSDVDVSMASDWQVDDPTFVYSERGKMVGLAPGEVTVEASFDGRQAVSSLAIEQLPEGNVPGYPDVNFAPLFNEFGGVVWSVSHQSGGRVLAGGAIQRVNGEAATNLVRLLPDGSRDRAFSENLGEVNGAVRKIITLADDSILIVGAFTQVGAHVTRGAARLHPDGRVDTSFRSAISRGTVLTALVDPEGRCLVGGSYLGLTGRNELLSLVRLRTTGAEDTTFFGTVISGAVEALGLDGDNRILVGATATPALRRLYPDGSVDTTFVTNVITNVVNDIAIQRDGKIVCVGSKDGEFLIRLQPGGALDETFDRSGHPFWGVTEAVALDAADHIYIAHRHGVRRVFSDGTVDAPFGTSTSPDFAIQQLVVTEDGDLWGAGGRSASHGAGTMGIARFHLDASGFANWRSRNFSYREIHETELQAGTIVAGAERSCLYYYAFGQDPRLWAANPVTAEGVGAGGASSLRLQINPEAHDVTLRLFYNRDLSSDGWQEFAQRPAASSLWHVSDGRFSITPASDGQVVVQVDEETTLFIRAEAILEDF